MAIDDLFQPLTVRALTVPNRFAMAPMTRQASPGGIPAPTSPSTTGGAPPAVSA